MHLFRLNLNNMELKFPCHDTNDQDFVKGEE